MNWKYYISTEWKSHERRTWADIWLLPDTKKYSGKSVWLTVDGKISASEYLPEELSESDELRTKGFFIEHTEMLVDAADFSRDDILFWAEIWLEKTGLPVTNLIEGTFEEFENSNSEAKAIKKAIAIHAELLELEKTA